MRTMAERVMPRAARVAVTGFFRLLPISALLSVALVAVGACGGADPGGDAGADDGSLTIVATTTVLGDVAENVTCGAAKVETLMSAGQDPHAFDLSARQAAELRDADLVVANGLGLEQTFTDVLLEARESGTPVLFVAEEVGPIPYASSGDQAGDDQEHDMLDPHVWLDPLRMAQGARLIGAELTRRAGSEAAAACAEEYAGALESLDTQIAESLAAIPTSSRKLVANHDALGYFADRYGFELVGVVIPSGSTLAEPSASDIVELVDAIEREGVPVIFAESIATAKLAETVASEAGQDVKIVHLYTGSLGEEGSGAETYVELIVTNAERVAAALAD